MFDINELLSKANQQNALNYFKNKKKGKGIDGVPVSELEEYWNLNKDTIIESIKNQSYEPGIIKNTAILNGKGKRRVISVLNTVDRFITRLLAQKLDRYYKDYFLENSFAYQSNKGIQEAVKKAQSYLNTGMTVKVEVDLKDFFEEISIERLLGILRADIINPAVITLISSYLYCTVLNDGEIEKKKKGLVQGNSMSPVLSNIYLINLDRHMDEKGYNWIRFADDITVFTDSKKKASLIFEDLCSFITENCEVKVNEQKCGIFNAFDRRMLGYEFYLKNGKVEIKKHSYKTSSIYKNWHECSIQKLNQEYHLIQNGILNRQDYALLFENEKEKHHIPVEVVDQLNVYNDIIISKSVLQTLSEKKILICFMNKYGDAIGCFVPVSFNPTAVLKQFELYLDSKSRFKVARAMEISAIHNLRSNLRYYMKRGKDFAQQEKELGQRIKEVNETQSIDTLMLIEARARELYYSCFTQIYDNEAFAFKKRSKQPPRDPINAMISFGNTLLYNRFLRLIWKTSLDPRVGCIHATNRRSQSLNFDFADMFKPIIVDRVIFSMINRKQIKETHFTIEINGGTYLTDEGKKIFVEQFEYKMHSKITVKGNEMTYQQLLEAEVRHYQRYILEGIKYQPYKYY